MSQPLTTPPPAVVAIFAAQAPQFIATVRDQIIQANLPAYRTFTPDQITRMVRTSVQAFQADLEAGTTDTFTRYWQHVGKTQGQRGVAIREVLYAANLGHTLMHSVMVPLLAHDSTALTWWLTRHHELTYSGFLGLVEVFLQAREQTIQAQAAMITELSSPLIPLTDRIMVLPLVGSMTAQRAQQTLETLLTGVSNHRASVVLIDLTGVSEVDTQVVQTLTEAAQAVRLLGAQVAITGIRPDVAQVLVQLGNQLDGVATYATLQAGIAAVLPR